MSTTTPTQIVILGGSGDLSKRKLLPALLDLYVSGNMPNDFNIIGLARTPRTSDEYRLIVSESIRTGAHNHSIENIELFCSHISYVTGNFDDSQSYKNLNAALSEYELSHKQNTNKLFYLAVPPAYYASIFEHLSTCCVLQQQDTETYWSRILVEKPFGSNLESAKKLEQTLSSLFQEQQIFRIDHYLAKEAVQNILSFRFANVLFSNIWNKDSIHEVRIKMHEKIGIESRGQFYDNIGALRDVGQNHLLQLLALVAMDEPDTFTHEEIRLKRADILKNLRPVTDISKDVLKAQYDDYTNEEGVAAGSTTETFFRIKTYIDTPKWQNVPFYIEAGKSLQNKSVVIEVVFNDVASGLFDTTNCKTIGNIITLTIEPEQSIELTFNAKQSGYGYQLEQRHFRLPHQHEDGIKNSYEKVLLDCIAGDQTLFTSTEEVFAAWNFITPILENWNTLPLHNYKVGSNGPEEVVQ